MFANTLTLTINAVDKVLTRHNQDNFGSEYIYRSGTESIRLLIRHSTDKFATGDVLRHNVFIERTIYATPTANPQYYSTTFTLRARFDSDPVALLQLYVGAVALLASLDDGLVIGDN